MGKHKDSVGWSLSKRGGTWFVYYRTHSKGKLIGKTTGKSRRDEAFIVARSIVFAAKEEYALSFPFPKGISAQIMKSNIYQLVSDEIEADEEFLNGPGLDKTNPRIQTLWDFQKNINFDDGIYLDYIKSNPKYNSARISNVRAALKNFFSEYPSDLRIRSISSTSIEDFVNRRTDSGLSQRSISTALVNIKSFFKWCLDRNFIDDNPVKIILKVTEDPKKKLKIIKVFSDYQIEKSMEVLSERAPNMAHLFFIGIHTGMRKSEISNLLWENVDIDSKRIIVTANDPNPNQGIFRSTLKTFNSYRIVPMKDILIDYLKSIPKTGPYVISAPSGQWRNQAKIYKGTDAILKSIHPNWHFHMCRHTFVSKALNQRIPPPTIAKWIGDNLSTLLSTYSHLVPENNDINQF